MPKLPTCKICKEPFIRTFTTVQRVCSVKCAQVEGKDKIAKKARKEHSEAKRRLKDNDRSFQVKKTQQIFNAYIRMRDQRDGCISCTKPFSDKFDAGHYRSTGAHPELRFNEHNNHGQCVHCNQHLSGNLVDYRIQLIKKIGLEKVEWIEGSHERPKLTIDDLKQIQVEYKAKIKLTEKESV